MIPAAVAANPDTQPARAAIRAWQLLKDGSAPEPRSAWDTAISEETESQDSREKVCPYFTFVGACEAGLVKGVRAGEYVLEAEKTRKLYVSNKDRAIRMVYELKKDPSLANDKKRLWALVGDEESEKNGQADVVL